MNLFLKKSLAGALALLLMLGLSACDEGKWPRQETSAPTEAVQNRPNTGKCTDFGTPLADVRVRQALAYAIDTDTVVAALFHGNGEEVVSFGLPGASGDGAFPEYDPEKAKQLLAEAGWPSEYVLDVVYSDDDQLTVDVLNVICSYWEKVGIRSAIRKIGPDMAAQLRTDPEGAEEEAAAAWDLAFGEITALTEAEYYSRFRSSDPQNFHTPAQEGLDEQIGAGDYEKVRQILAENVLAIPLYHQNGFLYTSNHVSAVPVGNDRFAYEKNILNWVTDREDNTLYTNGGPVDCYRAPVENPGQHLYQELIFERLVGADGQLNPTDGVLAEDYQVSGDGRTVTFTLREDLFWQDGQALTGEDVKFTFELYMLCPDAGPVLTGVLGALEGAREYKNGDAAECTGIQVAENTVTFVFEKETEDVLTVFSQWPILPRHCLEDANPENLRKHSFWKNPVGSGPYRVAETVMGEYCVLERWEEYRLSGEGNIQRIYMASSGEIDVDLILRAQLDMLDYAWGTSADDGAAMEQIAGMEVISVQINCMRCFYINQFPHEPFHAEVTE